MKTSVPAEKKIVSEPFAMMANPEPSRAACGDLVIYETAVASIVKRTVSGISGIARFSGCSFVDNIAEIVRSRKIQDRSIALKFINGTVAIDLSVVLYFGYNIPDVAAQVQSKTAEAVFRMTGLKVSNVNINVRSIEDPTEEEEKQDLDK